MSDYEFFSSKDPSQWGEVFQSLWGCLDICPFLNQFHVASKTHSELSSLTSLKAYGDVEKFCSNVAFLLVLTVEGAVRDRIYGLSMIRVNPYQVRIPTIEEAVKQLTALVSTGPNWPYTLVWLNGETCHAPLPREGHLNALVEGTSSADYGRVSQLEVCQLLSLSSQVVYPAGLNGCEVPIIASLPESLTKGTNLLGGKPIYLKVDILQPIMEGTELKVLPLCSQSSSILMASPTKATLPKAEREVSMIMEVRALLSQVGLDMSGHISENSTPKRLNPMVLLTHPPTKLGDLPRPVNTSSQVSTLDDAEMGHDSLEEIPAAPSPTAETQGLSSSTPPTDADHF